MKVLVVGGTRFVGRALVEALLEAGDTPTLFHRGRSGADLFPDVERILGDRDADLHRLEGRTWDAVVDTCGYLPRQTRALGQTLARSVCRSVFVSSISVYDDPGAAVLTEQSRRAVLADPTTETVDGATYGGLKALAEDAVLEVWGECATIVRPTLVVGPHDPTDRFTWWPVRLAAGPTLAPDRRDQPVQWIDVRDLAGWIVRALHAGRCGIANAAGPTPPISLGEFVARVAAAADAPAGPVWADPAWLAAEGVAPWSDLPLTLPADGSDDAMLRADGRRIEDVPGALRPLEETVRDTLAWYRAERSGQPLRAGLDDARHADLLARIPAPVA